MPAHQWFCISKEWHSADADQIQKYGHPSGYVELEGKRCIIRAGISTLGGNFPMPISMVCSALFQV